MSVKDDRLQIGSVIFEYITTTNPPKNKYYVVVGFSEDKVALGTVYINSEINPNIFRNERMRMLHIPLSSADNPFLKWDSHIDCSNIQERAAQDVPACIATGGDYGFCASLSEQTMNAVLTTLNNSFTIPAHVKKKFGIRK